MAGWISSKLKVAENILQQIDLQAAESLGKSERPHSPPPLDGASGDGDGDLKKKAETPPVKFQLHKKPPDRARQQDGGPRSPAEPSSGRSSSAKVLNLADAAKTSTSRTPPTAGHGVATSAAEAAVAMDGDWTELLGSSKPINPVDGATSGSSPSPRRTGKVGVPNRKSTSKPGRDVETVLAGEIQQCLPSSRNEDTHLSVKRHSGRSSVRSELSAGSPDSPNSVSGRPLWDSRGGGFDIIVSEPRKKMSEKSRIENHGTQTDASVFKDDERTGTEATVLKGRADAERAKINNVEYLLQSTATLQNSPPRLLSRFSSRSSQSSGSLSDSTSTSDSEYESERKMERRKRRERILAAKAAAVAAEAIKERENLVARLEGEKESLEKVLEECQKQQAQEASELQMSMMETMEAAELEKQKHNNTRMEALACVAKLENRNAELAKSLATAQWDLEVEVNRVVDLRELIESKELSQEELKRRISNVHQNALSSNHMATSKGGEYESKLLEAEYSFVCDKIVQLKEKARHLEQIIEMTKELVHPTGVEIELKKRLEQLTDNLIQKQAQVETLSSEKAMLLFRIETISRLLEENGMRLDSKSISSGVCSTESSTRLDIEAGTGEPSYSTPGPIIQEKITSGGQQLGSFLWQLDAVFSVGAMFLRKNRPTQLWSLVYLICLHFWVIYILLSHAQTSEVTSPGAVFSLESINKTSGS